MMCIALLRANPEWRNGNPSRPKNTATRTGSLNFIIMFAIVTMLPVGASARPLPHRQLLPLALQAKVQPRVPFAVRSIMDLNSGNLRTAENPIVFHDQPSFAGSESDLMVFDFIVVDSDPTSVRLIRSKQTSAWSLVDGFLSR